MKISSNKPDWSLWVAVAGAVWLSANLAQSVPIAQAQGGLDVNQWMATLAPLLAFVPKLWDMFVKDKSEFTNVVVAIASIHHLKTYLATSSDPAVGQAIDTLQKAVLEKLK